MYSSLHFYIQKKISVISNKKKTVAFEKNKLIFICQKLDARQNINLIGGIFKIILFHLMCRLFKLDKYVFS
jgi:hypothetical protein